MANTLLPIEERNLTPDQVELLDKRRRRGQLFLVLCLQCTIVGSLVTLWSGQDFTLSPGWTSTAMACRDLRSEPSAWSWRR